MQRLSRWRMACALWMGIVIECPLAVAHGAIPPAHSPPDAKSTQTEQSVSPISDDQLTPAAADQADPSGTWQILARSVEQRVIEYRQFGRGQQQILVVGPLEGDEPAGVELLERLVDHLKRFPRRVNDVTVTVVRDPNPDGRLRGARANARGVRLDMNFPTRQWRKVPMADRWLSGRTPESEPETRALIELLDDLKPDRMLLLAATRRDAELLYSAGAEPVARRLAAESKLQPSAWDAAAAPADFATYTGNDRQLPTLVLRIQAAAGADYNWTQYKRALLAAVEPDENDTNELTAANVHRLAALAHPRVSAARPTERRRVLSAKDLELGGVLAPVARPPVKTVLPSSTAMSPPHAAPRPPTSVGPLQAGPPARWMVPYRGAAPTGALSHTKHRTSGTPVPYGSIRRFAVPESAKLGSDVPSRPAVEDLPPVDPTQPPPRPLPQPIPLYPETGY